MQTVAIVPKKYPKASPRFNSTEKKVDVYESCELNSETEFYENMSFCVKGDAFMYDFSLFTGDGAIPLDILIKF